MNYVIGIKLNGERLRFERWVYERYRNRTLGDTWLKASLNQCVQFVLLY